MRFVWARKLDVTRAAELLKDHLEWREEYGINDPLDMDLMIRYLKNDAFPWSPGNYTKQGYSVSYLRPGFMDKTLLEDLGLRGVMQAHWIAMDTVLDHDIDVNRHGGIVVEDLAGASFWDLKGLVSGHYSWDVRKLGECLQNKLPFRMGGFIIVNAPWYIKLLTAAIKPFLKPKMRKKIHICSVDDLHHYFTDEQLPTWYGGKFEVKTDWVEEIFIPRGGLSNGKYISPGLRSTDLIEGYTGEHPIKTVEELAAEAKGKKKKKG